jgi:hypothetical protein
MYFSKESVPKNNLHVQQKKIQRKNDVNLRFDLGACIYCFGKFHDILSSMLSPKFIDTFNVINA